MFQQFLKVPCFLSSQVCVCVLPSPQYPKPMVPRTPAATRKIWFYDVFTLKMMWPTQKWIDDYTRSYQMIKKRVLISIQWFEERPVATMNKMEHIEPWVKASAQTSLFEIWETCFLPAVVPPKSHYPLSSCFAPFPRGTFRTFRVLQGAHRQILGVSWRAQEFCCVNGVTLVLLGKHEDGRTPSTWKLTWKTRCL